MPLDAPFPSDALLLAIETATDTCSVAVARGRDVLVDYALHVPRSHAERLAPMIGEALAAARVERGRLSAIAVSMGPGSFTGLRIGVSTAKGLAYALGIPLVGVSSLEALALGVGPFAKQGDVAIAAFNSRRDEVYLGAYVVAGPRSLSPLAPPRAVDVDALDSVLPSGDGVHRWVVGEGAPAVEARIGSPAGLTYLPGLTPAAGRVALIGGEALAEGRTADLAAFEPLYLKDFVPREKTRTIFERLPFGGGESS